MLCWIHCWLPLAVLSDYFGQLVTSTSLLCKCRGLPGSTSVRFPVMRLWKWLGMKRLSQPVAQLPGNGLRNLPEISKFFIFSQKKPFGETFSKITIKVSKEFSFSRKPPKSEMLPHAGLKPLNFTIFKALGKKGGWRKQVHLWQVSKASQLQYYLVKILKDNEFFTRLKNARRFLSSPLS